MSAPAATKKVARSASKKKTTPSKDAPKAKRGDGQRVSNPSLYLPSERLIVLSLYLITISLF